MDSAKTHVDGSTGSSSPAEALSMAGAHWACGMPLSYVQEMASKWLRLGDHASIAGAFPESPLSAAE